jgi:5-(carboxyamino)imidazole ribonucleotide synthase
MHETLDTDIRPDGPRRHPAIGIIGGGQLARMTAMAAIRLGCDVVVLERQPFGPAASLATHLVIGDWNDSSMLAALAARVDVVTLENEFVDAARLAELERAGATVFPTAATIARVQDKLLQKQTLVAAGLPVAPFCGVHTREDVLRAAGAFGWPVVLKARLGGYDGKGNVTVHAPADLDAAWASLGGDSGRPLYVEGFCAFERELAIIITRGRDGAVGTYPLVETQQQDHICRLVRAPAPVPASVTAAARDVAMRAAEAVGAVGSFGVELFQLAGGGIVINELAPRVHNSGHFSIEGCLCSQFENHVRAILGWPLGPTVMRTPAAVMVNLLGSAHGSGWPAGVTDALAFPDAAVHIYGKTVSSPGRKMGHVTVCAESLASAESTALQAAAVLKFGEMQ